MTDHRDAKGQGRNERGRGCTILALVWAGVFTILTVFLLVFMTELWRMSDVPRWPFWERLLDMLAYEQYLCPLFGALLFIGWGPSIFLFVKRKSRTSGSPQNSA